MASFASSRDADLLVLGSGIAGMLLAERALARGREVLLVERGSLIPFEERRERASHRDSLAFNAPPPQTLGPDGAYTFDPVYGVGGSTSHFFGNLPRIHPSHFEAGAFGGMSRHWPVGYAELEPYYLEAERRLGVSGDSQATPFAGRYDYPLPPHRLSPMDRACREVFGAAHVLPVPSARPSQPIGGRPACCGTNHCSLCPIDSKGTALNTVFPSIRGRLELLTGRLARELRCARGRVEEVRAIDAQGRTQRLRARQVVVACNGVDSCLLLQASPSVPQHTALGRYYMDHAAFNLAIYGSGLDARPGYGDSAQTAMVTAFFEKLSDRLPVSMLGEVKGADLGVEAGGSDREQVLADVFRFSAERRFAQAPELRARVSQNWRSTLLLRFLVETQPLAANTVSIRGISPSGQPIPDIRMRFPDYLEACIEAVSSRVRTRLPHAEVRVLGRALGVQHWLGATRASDSPQHGCVDRNLRYHGIDNLFVLSASCFPGSSSANPTLTLAALALRLADQLGARGASNG